MLHKMRLRQKEFNNIIYNNKVIEVRLNDNKRKKIKKGDNIQFFKESYSGEYVYVKVIDISFFNSFRELYKFYSTEKFGYGGRTVDDMLNVIYNNYSVQQEEDNGVVAIQFNII